MSWFITDENIEDALKVTILLYGDTGSGKTSLLGEYAEWKFKLTGKRTRLYTADPGGWLSIKPYVKLGIIEVVNLVAMPRPWEWIAEVVKGKVPIAMAPDGSPIWAIDAERNAGVGVYAFEGGTAFGRVLLDDQARRNAAGQVIGPQRPNFQITEGNVTWAGTAVAQFGNAQTVLTLAIQESFHLPGDVIWTCLARRAGDADTTAPVLGPQFAGRALTSDAPSWFNYTFRAVTISGNDLLRTKSEHRLYIEDIAETHSGIGPDNKPITNTQKTLANPRLPLDADAVEPFVSPASIVGAIAMIEKGGTAALDKIRARVAAARPRVA